jgi:hypothetical protein
MPPESHGTSPSIDGAKPEAQDTLQTNLGTGMRATQQTSAGIHSRENRNFDFLYSWFQSDRTRYEYVEDGTTHIVLHLDNTTYSWVETTRKGIAADRWNELMVTQPTQNVTMYIEKRGDRWIITYFDNPSIQ